MNNNEYALIINELVSNAAAEIVAANHDRAATLAAIKNYLRQGRSKSLSLEELVAFFGVSSDCVVDRAGLPEGESASLMRLLGELCDSMASDWD